MLLKNHLDLQYSEEPFLQKTGRFYWWVLKVNIISSQAILHAHGGGTTSEPKGQNGPVFVQILLDLVIKSLKLVTLSPHQADEVGEHADDDDVDVAEEIRDGPWE